MLYKDLVVGQRAHALALKTIKTLDRIGHSLVLTVSDIKQFFYCRRVVYFTYALSGRRPTTYKMEEGKREHEHVEELERRRSLRSYGLADGERHFDVRLYSQRLGLSGLMDMVIERSREVIPVDFKNSSGPLGLNHKYQLTGYALLAEERWQRSVRRGFIYFIADKRAQEVVITPAMREQVQKTLNALRRMIGGEALPSATRQRGRCVDCEFRNFCNDV